MDANYVKNIKTIAKSVAESRITHLIFAFILGFIACSLYDKYHRDIATERHLRQVDSLRIEIANRDSLNNKLKMVGDSLDNEIQNATARVDTIYRSFPVYKRPPITTPDSATKFIKDFINE